MDMDSHHQTQQQQYSDDTVSVSPVKQQQQEQQSPQGQQLEMPHSQSSASPKEQQDPQVQPQPQVPPPLQATRGGRKANRARGSLRGAAASAGRRPSSSSGTHQNSPHSSQNSRPQNDSPRSASGSTSASGIASMTNIINFGDTSATTSASKARTPIRGRGNKILISRSSHASRPHHTSSSMSPTSGSGHSNMPNTDLGPRTDRTPKQGLAQSFTFSSPQPNARNSTGRKRARTLEYPTESGGHGQRGATGAEEGDGEDDAKVKGGHSLRRRARIDYAQMNNEDDTDVPRPVADREDPQQITVSGARPVRAARRKNTMGADVEDQEEQTSQAQQAQQPSSNVAQKKTRALKQRTASPVPAPPKRAYTKRKSNVLAVPVDNKSPEQQASDTELKDTIEVGAPLAMTFTSSSSNSQPSEAASSKSGQSPAQNGSGSVEHATMASATKTPVAAPANAEKEAKFSFRGTSSIAEDIEEVLAHLSPTQGAGEHASEDGGVLLSPSAGDDLVDGVELNGSDGDELNLSGLASLIENTLQESPDIIRASAQSTQPATGFPPPHAEPPELDQTNFHINSITAGFPPYYTNSVPAPGSSHGSIDSDTTEILPPEGPIESNPTARSAFLSNRKRLTLRSKQTPSTPQQQQQRKQNKMSSTQESQKRVLPRRGAGRAPEDPVVLDDGAPGPSSSKDPALPDGLPKGFDPTNCDRRTKEWRTYKAHQEAHGLPLPPVANSADVLMKRTPRKVAPKRQSIDHQPVLPPKPKGLPTPKERRAIQAARRAIPPQPKQDYSHLTPYLENERDMYPEIRGDSGAATPLETPVIQPSDAAADDLGSVAPENRSEEATPGLDRDMGSNVPTPAALSDAPTPGPDSAAASRANSPEPVIRSMRKAKQRSYPRIRSPSDFTKVLDNFKELSDENLSNILAQAAKALGEYQEEYIKEKLITEDEDNAYRRQIHDQGVEAREARAIAKSTNASNIDKRDFEIKGIRAERAKQNMADNPRANYESYVRGQDQIMANVYGFALDSRANMVGKQEPESQRNGSGDSRLRNRPKPSLRAAEAGGEEVPEGVILGKRVRKPVVQRVLSPSFDSNEPSLAPTPEREQPPAEKSKRRRRVRDANDDLVWAPEDKRNKSVQPQAPPASQPILPLKKKRGPKPKAVKEAEARAAAEAAAAAETEEHAADTEELMAEQFVRSINNAMYVDETTPARTLNANDEQPISSRKRRRRGFVDLPDRDIPTASIEDAQGQPAPEEGESARKKRRVGRQVKQEIPPAQFYSASSVPTGEDTNTPEEARPSTSSSTSSERTVGSTYELRNRPKRNYAEIADPMKENGRPNTRKRTKLENEPTSNPGSQMSSQQAVPSNNSSQQVQASPLAPPTGSNVPFVSVTGSGPSPLLAPPNVGPSNSPAPHQSVRGGNGNSFLAPSQQHLHPDSPPALAPATRTGPKRIKLTNNRGRTASKTPQPPAAANAAAKSPGDSNASHMPHQLQQPSFPLQPPSSFHGHVGGGEFNIFGPGMGPIIPSLPGTGMILPNNTNTTASSPSLPPVLQPIQTAPVPSSSTMMGRDRSGSDVEDGRAGGRIGTPAGSSVGEGEGDSEKGYSQMSKSEKMSASMKARWANGSMTGAVHKRKETLARKKYTNKYGEEIIGTPGPESLAGTPSVEPPRMFGGGGDGASPSSRRASMAESSSMVPAFLNYDGAGGGVGLSQPQAQQYGEVFPGGGARGMGMGEHHQQQAGGHHGGGGYSSGQSNPFLDHGYAERGPRLPTFSSNGGMGLGGYGGAEVKREERPGYPWGPHH